METLKPTAMEMRKMMVLTISIVSCVLCMNGQTPLEITKMGVEKYNAGETEKGIELLKQAFEQYEPNAWFYLGYLAINGKVEGMSPESGRFWVEKSAEQGVGQAQMLMGNLCLSDNKLDDEKFMKGYAWYRKAKAQGVQEAVASVAQMDSIINSFSEIEKGIYLRTLCYQKEYELAFEWFEKESNAGNDSFLYDLGFMYYKGIGTKEDCAKAEEWMVKAATKGRCRAQWFLYNVYMSGGTCFKKDADKAVMWMKKAVAQGYNQAYFMQEYQNSWMSKVDR